MSNNKITCQRGFVSERATPGRYLLAKQPPARIAKAAVTVVRQAAQQTLATGPDSAKTTAVAVGFEQPATPILEQVGFTEPRLAEYWFRHRLLGRNHTGSAVAGYWFAPEC